MLKRFVRCAAFFVLKCGLMAQQSPAPPVPVVGDPFYAPVATSGPQTLKEKAMSYAVVTLGPPAVFTPLFTAAIRMANPPNAYPREWKDGAGAFGRNYGNEVASRTAEESARFLTGALLHEDFRYHPSSSKNFGARTFHALAFTFVDRSDSGHPRLAVSNFAAATARGFVANAYLPPGFDNAGHAETRAAVAFAGLAGQNLLREFAPDVERLATRFHVPFPRVPLPAWWVKH
jgi:hypothetical protein